MRNWIVGVVVLGCLAVAPWLGAYPVFLMKLMCFALFACSLNLLLGHVGLLSFGHAAFFGGAAFIAGSAMRITAAHRKRRCFSVPVLARRSV